MLSPTHVVNALERKRDRFGTYDRESGQERAHYADALCELASMSREEVWHYLSEIERPGARPTSERIAGNPVVRPFAARWEHHGQARAWALEILRDRPTVAVDGSEISPSRDYSLPVGAVQVARFINHHRAEGDYVKDLTFDVLAPDELTGEANEEGFPDQQVKLRRYELECSTLIHEMTRLSGHEPLPVCFFDGSLIASFAANLPERLRRRYLAATVDLLHTSQRTGVPLVGYIDTSYAKDLVTMLYYLKHPSGAPPTISDPALLRREMAWGDRTEAWVCARDDELATKLSPDERYYERVHLVYLKTTATNPPARLDLPAWLLEAGLLEEVVDVVRAECIVGIGYPYAVETADATAVITARDRERFYGIFQQFIDRLGVELRYSKKALSKRGRR
ncbi:MAG: DNA double-strand break repair nuclease NurA [Chloroflexi bacterium]|nr:DNA double-strand break repair nuclease NurA [Chloroflexota bacterium]